MKTTKIGKFTTEEIADMDAEEYSEKRPEIMEAINKGDVSKTETFAVHVHVIYYLVMAVLVSWLIAKLIWG